MPPDPRFIRLRHDDRQEHAAVVALWQRCDLLRPWNDPYADIALALSGANAAVLARFDGAEAIAAALVGHDGHRGALYYVATDPAHRRKGLGRALVAEAERWLAAEGVPKLNIMIRPENRAVAAFYAALGYATEERVVMARRLGGATPQP